MGFLYNGKIGYTDETSTAFKLADDNESYGYSFAGENLDSKRISAYIGAHYVNDRILARARCEHVLNDSAKYTQSIKMKRDPKVTVFAAFNPGSTE